MLKVLSLSLVMLGTPFVVADVNQAKEDFRLNMENHTHLFREALHQEFQLNQEQSVTNQLKLDYESQKKTVTKLVKTIERETANLSIYRQDIPRMKTQIIKNKEKIVELKQDLPPLKVELNDIQDDLRDEQDKLREKEFELEQKNDDVADKNRDIRRIQDRIDNLNHRMDDPDSSYSRSVDSLSEAHSRLNQVESRINSDASRIRSHNEGRLPPCVRRRMTEFNNHCDAGIFLQKKRQRINKINQKLNDPNVPQNKKNKLRKEKSHIEEAIRYTEHIIKLFDHRDSDLIPLRDEYQIYEDEVRGRDRLKREADRYERDIVTLIRARVKKMEEKESDKLWEIQRLKNRISGLERSNRDLADGIEFRERRLVELEGPNGNDGLLKKWEEIDLPRAKKDSEAAQLLYNDQLPILDAQEKNYKNSFTSVIDAQELQEEARIQLYEEQNQVIME